MTDSYKLPLEVLYQWEQQTPDKIYFHQPRLGKMETYTWKEVGNQVRRVAAWLKALNLEPGSNIGILSKNCAHWIMADLAIWMSGHVSVPLYPNLTAHTINQIMTHSGSKLLFVGKLDGWEDMKPGVPGNVQCVSFPYGTTHEYKNWEDIVAETQPLTENPPRDKDEIATIIYTSGTTGMPKGVVHRFYAMAFAITNYVSLMNMSHEKFFSYLPLSHVAERVLAEMGSLYSCSEVTFAESLDTFAQNLRDASPTVFLGVPRIWSKFQLGILAKLPQEKLDRLLSIPLVSFFIRKKLKKALGLSRVKVAITGAAPMPESLMLWYQKLGIEILEAYSMTENFAYSHLTRPHMVHVGYVGQPLPHNDVKLSAEGEVLVKSETTMLEYYKEPEKTAEVMTNGYLRTGDQGAIDKDGYLKITGRVKDLFKTSKGKYVAPTPIEKKFTTDPMIEQVCLVGAGLPQPIVLLVLSDIGNSLAHHEVSDRLKALMASINSTLDSHERVQKAVLVKSPWTVENELLTPTMKVKRNVIEKMYQSQVEQWDQLKESIIWEH
ncbi:MAG: AMP-binding protein [SAR324 cluster bacterium]|nr:AMP-binding protein [SAR324 cluster bacterium]